MVALMRTAPPKTVVHREDKDTGDSIRVWVGDGVQQPPPGVPGEPKS